MPLRDVRIQFVGNLAVRWNDRQYRMSALMECGYQPRIKTLCTPGPLLPIICRLRIMVGYGHQPAGS
jgi:hypothetical protein